MQDLLVALGLVLFIEGVVWALFPGGMRRAVELLAELPAARLRQGGLIAACAGLFLVWLVRG
ncbi:MAG: DUF2065 domain-containing protein [Alphaproteobacteria bacterium]|nr:DUF2065 domain-containing protein [Alphaproteobacteria bacterium]